MLISSKMVSDQYHIPVTRCICWKWIMWTRKLHWESFFKKKKKQEHLVQHSSRLEIWFIADNGLGMVFDKLEPEDQALSVGFFHRKTHRKSSALRAHVVEKGRTRFDPDTPRVYSTQVLLSIRLSFMFLWENIWSDKHGLKDERSVLIRSFTLFPSVILSSVEDDVRKPWWQTLFSTVLTGDRREYGTEEQVTFKG